MVNSGGKEEVYIYNVVFAPQPVQDTAPQKHHNSNR
jgi:hypothetical protein